MSLGAWGDEGNIGMDGYVTDERAEEMFVEGARAMREMLARFVEQGGDNLTAMSIRANWNPEWGKDPGRPDRIAREAFDSVGDYKPKFEKTYCSHCAREFGPGDHGYSHCEDHKGL